MCQSQSVGKYTNNYSFLYLLTFRGVKHGLSYVFLSSISKKYTFFSKYPLSL